MSKELLRKLRIDEHNLPLLELPESHPARMVLIIHAQSRDICVGKEIDWPNVKEGAIDQEWFSEIDQRKWSFSSFAYSFISFDLVLGGWLNKSDELQPFENDFLHELPRLRKLLQECELTAKNSSNVQVLPLITQTHKFFDAYENSIFARVGPVDVEHTDRRIISLWGAGKNT